MSYLLPRAKLLRVTFFMKRSYLLPRENFELPYLPNQAHWDPRICTQLRSIHIHSIHQKSRDSIHGNCVYLALICDVWSNRGRAGKKVTAVTFFRCPTVLIKRYRLTSIGITILEIRRSHNRLMRGKTVERQGPGPHFKRLIVRSREVSKPRDLYLELSDNSAIWQAPRQHCWYACQISK